MNTQLLGVLPLLLLLGCSTQKELSHVLPGEWEPQKAVWLSWEDQSDSKAYQRVNLDIIKNIQKNVEIRIVTNSETSFNEVKRVLEAYQIDCSNIELIHVPGNRYWMRDHGPTFVRNKQGELIGVDFDWLRRKGQSHKLPKVDRKIAQHAGFNVIASNVVNEGGAIESNGAGTILLVESVTLHRNPFKTKKEIEAIYQSTIGAQKIIWLKRGLAQDPLGFQQIKGDYFSFGTGGHVDEFARFINPNTILLAWVSEDERKRHPINQLNYDRLQEAYQILRDATDQDGQPFQIIKIPLPDLITEKRVVTEAIFTDKMRQTMQDFETIHYVANASYNNFLLTNGHVLLPTYVKFGSSHEKEEKVREIFKQLFPTRKIIFIDCLYQNFRGGGIHCVTKQQPF